MLQKGDTCRIVRDALEILPFEDEPPCDWLVEEVYEDSMLIRRILPDGTPEELLYEITEPMVVLIQKPNN